MAGLSVMLAAAGPPAQSHVRVTSVTEQVLRGWGMALAWDANVIYGSPHDVARLQDPVEQGRYMDLLFGDPASSPGLGLNVARYNIGGGDNPDRAHCLATPPHDVQPGADMEGFLAGPDGGYDWSRDASQRRMLHEAQARGATVFEAFSNSAPWWLTVSGCASGAERSGEDNLRADAVPAFTAYLARVARHFRTDEGITFESVSPVNEPDGTWWVRGNHQEGSFASLPMQEAVIDALGRELQGTGILVSGTEANNLDHMTDYLARMDPAALAVLGRVNVHQYDGNGASALHRKAAALGKPLWASEVGCCLSDDPDDRSGALFMALSIQKALLDLGADVWCFWQPSWGVIDVASGHPQPLRQFYAIAQYTRFIRPGFTVLLSEGGNTLATVSPDGRRLVLVAVNVAAQDNLQDFDLVQLHRAGARVAIYRTTTTGPASLAVGSAAVRGNGHLIDRQLPRSITTYVIDGQPIRPRRDRGPG